MGGGHLVYIYMCIACSHTYTHTHTHTHIPGTVVNVIRIGVEELNFCIQPRHIVLEVVHHTHNCTVVVIRSKRREAYVL